MRLLDRLKRSSFARDTGHLTLGQGLRLAIQAVYFVLIARILGPSRYGAFASIVALAGVFTPFSGLGTPNLFIKNVRSGKRKASICWGNGLAATLGSGSLFVAIVFAVDILFRLRIPLGVVAGVCCSDLILMRVTELAMFGFGAIDRMKDNAVQAVVSSALRLAAIALLPPLAIGLRCCRGLGPMWQRRRREPATRSIGRITAGAGLSSICGACWRMYAKAFTSVLERRRRPFTTTSIK